MIHFYLVRKTKVSNLKNLFSDFLRTSLTLRVDFSLSFTLVISQFIQGNFQRKTSDWFFWLFYSKIFWLFYYYFDFFWFNRGCSVNNWLDFALTVIKRDYNAYDRLKFILSFIRWDNGLNDRLKLVKNGRKKKPKVNEIKMKANKTRNELKVSDSKTYWLKNEDRTKNGWRTAENLHGFAHENVSEALRKHLSLDFLHGNNFFHPKQPKCIA